MERENKTRSGTFLTAVSTRPWSRNASRPAPSESSAPSSSLCANTASSAVSESPRRARRSASLRSLSALSNSPLLNTPCRSSLRIHASVSPDEPGYNGCRGLSFAATLRRLRRAPEDGVAVPCRRDHPRDRWRPLLGRLCDVSDSTGTGCAMGTGVICASVAARATRSVV